MPSKSTLILVKKETPSKIQKRIRILSKIKDVFKEIIPLIALKKIDFITQMSYVQNNSILSK